MEPLAPVDADTLLRMLRFAIQTGADRVHFRPGCPPLADGLGGARLLRFRQLCGDDTAAIAEHLLARAHVPERLRRGGADAAARLPLWVELPGEALLDVHLALTRGGIQLAVDLIRPLPERSRPSRRAPTH